MKVNITVEHSRILAFLTKAVNKLTPPKVKMEM